MKKLIGTLAAALLAAAVFADIGLGGFGRAIWVPVAYDGAVKMAQGVSWGGTGPRVGFSLGGSSDNVGVALDIKGDNGNLSVNDNAFIWAKPWSWLKIQAGQWFDDTLRGGCYFASWDWLRPGNAHADDLTFARIYNTGAGSGIFGDGTYDPMKGVLLSLAPVDGLYIAIGLNTGYGAKKIVDVFKTSQYQIGYTVDGIIAIKAQYIGSERSSSGVWTTHPDAKPKYKDPVFDTETGAFKAAELDGDGYWDNDKSVWVGYGKYNNAYKGVINAAVDILAIEGQKISFGAYYDLTPKKTGLANVGVAATYNGSFDALSLGAYATALIPLKDDVDQQTRYNICIGVGMGYDLGDGMAIEADVRADLGMPTKLVKDAGATTKADISVGAYFSKGFSNGKVGVGVIAEFGSWKTTKTTYESGGKAQQVANPAISLLSANKVSVAIPVKLEYWF